MKKKTVGDSNTTELGTKLSVQLKCESKLCLLLSNYNISPYKIWICNYFTLNQTERIKSVEIGLEVSWKNRSDHIIFIYTLCKYVGFSYLIKQVVSDAQDFNDTREWHQKPVYISYNITMVTIVLVTIDI